MRNATRRSGRISGDVTMGPCGPRPPLPGCARGCWPWTGLGRTSAAAAVAAIPVVKVRRFMATFYCDEPPNAKTGRPESPTISRMQPNESNGIGRWWRVVGGLSMNLALGTLYAWSVFVAPLESRFGWKRADTSMVFTIAVIVFALSFVVAGRIQDRFGPLVCSLVGGILVSLGFYLCSYTATLGYLYVCFGIIGGLGNGFGYATPIPVMAKWFPDKRGL